MRRRAQWMLLAVALVTASGTDSHAAVEAAAPPTERPPQGAAHTMPQGPAVPQGSAVPLTLPDLTCAIEVRSVQGNQPVQPGATVTSGMGYDFHVTVRIAQEGGSATSNLRLEYNWARSDDPEAPITWHWKWPRPMTAEGLRPGVGGVRFEGLRPGMDGVRFDVSTAGSTSVTRVRIEATVDPPTALGRRGAVEERDERNNKCSFQFGRLL